jgi:hypothetical protein
MKKGERRACEFVVARADPALLSPWPTREGSSMTAVRRDDAVLSTDGENEPLAEGEDGLCG